ncbi:sigma-54-dependent Fis family transcriptional regulator [Immundisolibacter sp.]|uniref:sigma-54-dependent Fis family transcriptional regulator n=1 Tax=Immundisolibacter sp. TaxID=1934948 RepID=UPI00261DF3A8|nr:sigma-54-dependent Fis family transcriptional regulator [Immundisolibacter sp.]MDD3651493.1 sigma 54-interacting transcriptional regulator [Immundisolibacter sp.]
MSKAAPAANLPDIRDLAEQVRFTPDTGRIWVRDQRGVLLTASVYGALRRELIDRLGPAVARELLSRIGYAEGGRDAEAARRLRPDVSYFDAFAVGPQVHALAGFGWSEVVHLNAEPASGAFAGEFLVHDSLEAATHLDAYGQSPEPVCWMQSGYASGFASAFAGRPILMREVECRGMGHEACRLVGKPLDEWLSQAPDTRYYQPEASVNRFADAPAGEHDGVVGISAGFGAAMHLLRKAADSRATLLFVGETGVGKEVFARLAHRMSSRRKEPFIAVNCAALPETLIETELFGVVKGAYTGASSSRAGRFERADGGTLFLDEVTSLSLAAQGKLLRALQEREIERVGDNQTRPVDVRVMAACNEDLRRAVDDGRFREDLYFRLTTFPVPIPPLRERRDDIPLLMAHLLRRFCAAHGKHVPGFTARAVQALFAYDFPGNVRELENIIERAVLLAGDGEAIDLPQLALHGGSPRPAAFALDGTGRLSDEGAALREQAAALLAAPTTRARFDAIEHALLEQAVADANGNLAAAARALGLTRRQVQLRLERHRRGSAGRAG